ncbi:hypothetical protein, partial [Salinactinospora qingdaonensis]|uniref:hypothetical protein n=1 Tax=Salinactinospora qingdaonensis TaxID=702744 RepID=UPI0031EF5BAE
EELVFGLWGLGGCFLRTQQRVFVFLVPCFLALGCRVFAWWLLGSFEGMLAGGLAVVGCLVGVFV